MNVALAHSSSLRSVPSAKGAFEELCAFGWKNAASCLFPVLIFASLALSRVVHIPYVPRYDALLVVCLGIQIAMVRLGLESRREAFIITVFHLLGLAMEMHKVRLGSWAYPESAFTKVGGVPLYSGFMYASVASFMCQAWHRFDLRFHAWPRTWVALALAAAIYVNFMTNHVLYDVRWVLVVLLAIAFRKTHVSFVTKGRIRRLPMLLSFAFIGGFVWLAENIATYFGAWRYPYQENGWQPVHVAKLVSWGLLVVVSLVLVHVLRSAGTGQRFSFALRSFLERIDASRS
jgi:uncharacterized membrane protein YoaT (DUF817 family)